MPLQNPPSGVGEPGRCPPNAREIAPAGNAILVAAGLQTNTIALSGVNPQHRGISVFVNISGAPGGTTPTLTVTISAVDPVSGALVTLLVSAALNAAGCTLLQVYPGLPATANVSANAVLPSQWQVSYTIGGTTPTFTGTIDAVLQP